MQIYAGTLRYISVPAVALLMTACGAARLSAPSSEEHDVSYRMYHHRVVACGLERWSVKTGTDSAARRVNTRRVVNTSIAHMRSLSPPAYLPSSSRIRPVETTVFRIRAVLLQIKEEADSDFHLVLADSRGRTMIAEIPAPQCVGLRSPFTGKIQYARRVATARLHPGYFWTYVHSNVLVTGVGFFDFQHGQTGVAPNAIELHPVLGLRFLGGPVRVPPPPPLPVPRVSGPFSIHVSAYPQTVRKGDRETISARTRSGVVCNLRVTYPDGYVSRARSITESKTAINGLVSWSWSVGSTVLGQSQAQVTCRSGTRTATAGTGFRIV